MESLNVLTRDTIATMDDKKSTFKYHPMEPYMDQLTTEPTSASFFSTSDTSSNIGPKVMEPSLRDTTGSSCSFQTKRGYLILTLVILLTVSILIVLFLVTQIANSPFFGTMGYPSWAPHALTMTLIGFFTFAITSFGFIFLNKDRTRRYIPYVLGLMIAEVLSLVLFLFFMYSTGLALVAVFVMALVLLVEIYIIVFLGMKSPAAMAFQIPYLLFLLLLLIIVIFIAIG